MSKEKDYAVIVFAGQRNAQGKIKGWHIDLTIPAKSEKEAVKKAGEMLASDSHIWGKNKSRKKKEK